ncbi:unnamed protein product [Calicophoron daubneyi]|uniref:Uncharacterized protein n=1 Tax=Calicophoron daubneyi TaxID=300641 RepID=A0AAV2TLM5_CALDB
MSDSQPIIHLSNEETGRLSCLNVVHLATARAAELSEFEAAVNVLTARALTGLQRLPVRLRRRAASHRVNRLPRRLHRHHSLYQGLRGAGATASASVLTGKRQKLKCRRFRRRTLRLLSQATRFSVIPIAVGCAPVKPTSGKAAWLPTHIWHAKRFHMTERWGWRLPLEPTNKVFKACQYAALNGCLAFDMSYLSCLELCGPESELIECVQRLFQPYLCSPSISPPLNAQGVPDCACEQTGLFFAILDNQQGKSLIGRSVLGPARLLWGVPDSFEKGVRCAYFWVHPAMRADALSLLEASSLLCDTSPPHTSVRVTDLTGQLCRMRTIGRQSHQLLADILVPQPHMENNEDWTIWRHVTSRASQACCLPCGTVLYLPSCTDFRSNRPRLKIRNRNWCMQPVVSRETPTVAGPTPNGKRISWSFVSSGQSTRSPWSLSSPNLSLSLHPSDMTGTEISTADEVGTDVLLIQNATPSLINDTPESAGWDIVFTRSRPQMDDKPSLRGTLTARDLLIACVYRGAEVGGQRELERWSSIGTHGSAAFEAYPLVLWPDTEAGRTWAEHITEQKWSRHGRLPPKLRVDYARLHTPHPYSFSWGELVTQSTPCPGTDDSTDWFVLRDPALLRLVVHRMISGDLRARVDVSQLARYHPALPKALIPIRISMCKRGVPEAYSQLYAPSDECESSQLSSSDSNPLTVEWDAKRQLLGYVLTGAYDYTVGHGTGLGLIGLARMTYALSQIPMGSLSRIWMKRPSSKLLRAVHISVLL